MYTIENNYPIKYIKIIHKNFLAIILITNLFISNY